MCNGLAGLSPHRGQHGVLRFWIAELDLNGRPLAGNGPAKIFSSIPDFLNSFDILYLP